MLKNESPKISDINYALNVSNAAARLHIKATYQLFNASAASSLNSTITASSKHLHHISSSELMKKGNRMEQRVFLETSSAPLYNNLHLYCRSDL